MGVSISVTAANLTIEAIEAWVLPSFVPAPKIFPRYIDNCFSILQSFHLFMAHLNSMQAAIKFTVEVVSNGQLLFLDTPVKRKGPRLFSMFRKHTYSGRYLHYSAVHPVHSAGST